MLAGSVEILSKVSAEFGILSTVYVAVKELLIGVELQRFYGICGLTRGVFESSRARLVYQNFGLGLDSKLAQLLVSKLGLGSMSLYTSLDSAPKLSPDSFRLNI